MRYYLKCMQDGEEYDSDYRSQICGKCGGILEVVYTGSARKAGGNGGFWDCERVLPECNYAHYELGSTRMVRNHEMKNVLMKMEIDNPTRSFKDRGSVVEISKAVEYGYKEVAVASTGNMAYSLAYYAKLAGLRAKVFISIGANKDKLRDIRSMHDADIDFVDGDFTKAQKLAIRYSKKTGAFLAGDYCYRKEGQKTIAYEIIDQLPKATHIVVPVGNATLISGVYKALLEMKAAKRIGRLPAIVAVQSAGSEPLIKAFRLGESIRYTKPRTAADAIAVGYPTFGNQAIDALKETNGAAIAVSDAELRKEQANFYKEYGLVAELAGVASIAAIRRLRPKNGDKVVAVISGGNV